MIDWEDMEYNDQIKSFNKSPIRICCKRVPPNLDVPCHANAATLIFKSYVQKNVFNNFQPYLSTFNNLQQSSTTFNKFQPFIHLQPFPPQNPVKATWKYCFISSTSNCCALPGAFSENCLRNAAFSYIFFIAAARAATSLTGVKIPYSPTS